MGSPLAQHPDVQEVIQRIGDRDVAWFEAARDKRSPSPSHLMFACASVLGDGGQEHIADLMKKVPGKQRRDKFIDLAIQLSQAADGQDDQPETPWEDPKDVEVVELDHAPTPKRKRRTKAEIEQDYDMNTPGSVSLDVDAVAIDVKALLEANKKLTGMVVELSKAVFDLDAKLTSNAKAIEKLETNIINSGLPEVPKYLTAIREGLCAAELELVMGGKLETAAISDTIQSIWPID